MSHEKDHCFQCQESGDIAGHCPNARCFECEEYRHIVTECPHRIPPSGTPAHHHRSQSWQRHPNRSTSCHHHNDRYRCGRSRSQSHPSRYCSHRHHDSHGGHSRSYNGGSRQHHRSTSWCLCWNTYIHHSHHNIPHRRSSSHRSSLAHSQDCSKSCYQSAYRPAKKTSHQNLSLVSWSWFSLIQNIRLFQRQAFNHHCDLHQVWEQPIIIAIICVVRHLWAHALNSEHAKRY